LEPEPPASTRQMIMDHESHDDSQVEREERLERAFQSLIAEGKKPSGRALAERAHVHRSTCITWLQVRQQKTPLTEQKSAEL